MGRARRKNYGQVQDESETKKNFVTVEDIEMKGEDCANQLVVSARGQTKKKKRTLISIPKKLTKKQRKHLEKVLEQKEKKKNRSNLLSMLSDVQVETRELAMMDSVAHIGTKNSKLSLLSKRPLPADLCEAIKNQTPEDVAASLKGWSGRGKRRRMQKKNKVFKPKSREDSASDEEDDSCADDNDDVEASDVTSSDESDECDSETKGAQDEEMEDSISNPEMKIPSTDAKEEVPVKSDSVKENSVSSDDKPVVRDPATYVHLDRTPEIEESRLLLPILAEEQTIMEAVKEHPIVIVCGETGSGKTTQVPQFLYEAGFAEKGMIGITEPRRVAAVSMSKRVATEMNLPCSKVSYHIRYENNVTSDTKVKFMTDGVLTREMKEDFLLSKYSALILDEAHERTANTDVLIGLLSRVVPLREKKGNPLKLIIMSATLRIEDFTQNKRLFKDPPPVIKIDVRQFPVTVHFNKKTPVSTSNDKNCCPYLRETYKKICKIHRTLPPGGILVFVTGKQEVHALIRKLKAIFPAKPVAGSNQPPDDDDKDSLMPKIRLDDYETKPRDNVTDEDHDFHQSHEPIMSDNDDGSDSEIDLDDDAYTNDVDASLPLHVLPLYSLLSPNRQRQVFDSPPDGCRLCVVATNVAETSLTIPGIKYVIDTGKVKRRLYDKITGVSTFQVTWVSKASANQRAGRAGRTEPGHAYRLYSSAVFQDFENFDPPEISSKPVAGLVLQMKSMRIDRVVNFPFPTPPPSEALESAESLLVSLGAIERPQVGRGSLKDLKKAQYSGCITDLGRLIASFPVHPRFGKMIAMATKHGDNIVAYAITIVSTLTVRELFVTPTQDGASDEDKETLRQLNARLHHLKALWSSVGGGAERRLLGDLMVLLGAVGSAEYSGASPAFCASNCIRPKALLEIRKLRSQLTNTINYALPDSQVCLDPKMPPPSDEQVKILRQIALSSSGDHVARLMPKQNLPPDQNKKMRGAYQCMSIDEPVFIHPESVLSRDPLPAYVIYQELSEGGKRIHMRDVTVVESPWLADFCPLYCSFSKPLATPEPTFDPVSGEVKCHVTATYGRLSWQLGEVKIPYPAGLDRYRWFARFLLEGVIVTSLKPFVSSLLSRPATMIKTWANLQPRTEVLLQELTKYKVDNKMKLLERWRSDPSYLRNTYLQWLPDASHNKFIASWPPS